MPVLRSPPLSVVSRRLPVLLLAGSAFGCGAGSALPGAGSPARPATQSGVGGSSAPAAAAYRQAESLLREEHFDSAALALLDLPVGQDSERVVGQMEVAASRLGREALTELAARANSAGDDPRLGPVFAQLALSYALAGQRERAQEFAARVGHARGRGRSGRLAAVLLTGGVPAAAPIPVAGAVMPLSGSPANREYARLFMEGVEVAAAAARRGGLPVELIVEDNRGTAHGSTQAAAALAERGAGVVLGPLRDANLSAAAAALPPEVVLFSPTAREPAVGRDGVYSLAGGDPGAARTLAAAVSDLGFLDAVVVHPRSPQQAMEAEAFAQAFSEAGGAVRHRLEYEPGTTTFEDPLGEAGLLDPEVLVVLAPPADLELLAPQIAFFELDETEVRVAGAAGWTAPRVLESVARRHTDSVVAVSPSPPSTTDADPARDFTEAYEQHFRRTLASPVPAVGYDLFRIALAAWAESWRTEVPPAQALEAMGPIEGATGIYSVVDGRLVREFFPVMILDGALQPLDLGATAVPEDPSGQRPGGS